MIDILKRKLGAILHKFAALGNFANHFRPLFQ